MRGGVVTEVGSEWWRRKAMKNFLAAGERRLESSGRAGLTGEGFWIETEWCRLGGGESLLPIVVRVVGAWW